MTRKLITPAVLAQKPPASGRVETKDTLSPLAFRITAAGARALKAFVNGERERQFRGMIRDRPPPPRIGNDPFT